MDLAELAQDAHLSRSRLGGLFVEQFGVPPIALLARLRVREMARLLRESDMTIAEIGVRVGWRNRGHAAEQFAKIMGVTPTAYRAEYRQRTQQTADDLTGCLWCGQPLPPRTMTGIRADRTVIRSSMADLLDTNPSPEVIVKATAPMCRWGNFLPP